MIYKDDCSPCHSTMLLAIHMFLMDLAPEMLLFLAEQVIDVPNNVRRNAAKEVIRIIMLRQYTNHFEVSPIQMNPLIPIL